MTGQLATESRKKSIGIVGGGLIGMTLALRLRKDGFCVSIIDSEAKLGGLASSGKIGDYTWDRFYHVILMSDLNLIGLLEELKLLDRLRWGETKTGFFTDGHLYSMSNTIEFLTFPPLGILDKLRLGVTIFYASRIKAWLRLERISVVDWLRKLSGERTFSKIWLPLLKSKLGENYKITSASFIWAIIARMYAARRSGLKKEMFGYVDGGYDTILDRFQRCLIDIGVETVSNTAVTKVVQGSHGVTLETAAGTSLKFDKVILTIPCSEIPGICPQMSLKESERFKNVTYQGIVSAALILKKPLAGYYVTNITDDWVPFTGVIEMTALIDKGYFDGNSLIYLPRYATASDDIWTRTDKQIEEDYYAALESMYTSFTRRDCVSFDISRARHVLPVTTLNYSAQVLPATKTSLEHVFVVNSAQIANGTMNVNELVGLANHKASEIGGFLS